MKITPITDYKEFYRTKDLPGCDKDILLAEVTDKGNPEILSFLPDADPERMVVQSSELCNHIIYYNMRQLLKLPTLGIIDQKQKYCSIYNSPSVMRNFFKGGAVKMITYRTVAETVILYGLTAEELRTISRWCCTFSMEEKNSRPLDFCDLTSFYNKKALSRLIGEYIDPATSGIVVPVGLGVEQLCVAAGDGRLIHVFGHDRIGRSSLENRLLGIGRHIAHQGAIQENLDGVGIGGVGRLTLELHHGASG